MARLIRPLVSQDRAVWEPLYRGYRDFYRVPNEPESIDRVFSWVVDGTHGMHGLLLTDDGLAVGLAHYRRYPSPLRGTTGVFLDDLFVDPQVRGAGVGRALIDHLAALAVREGHDRVRWTTAETNTVARRLYDTMAVAGPFLTYDRMITAR